SPYSAPDRPAAPTAEPTMRRRQFLGLGATAGLCAAVPVQQPVAAGGRPPARLKGGRQRGPTPPPLLRVFNLPARAELDRDPARPKGVAWTLTDLRKLQDLCGRHGVRLGMVALPWLTSSHIDREKRGAIVLGKEPERSRDVDEIHGMIAACARAGVPAFKYN